MKSSVVNCTKMKTSERLLQTTNNRFGSYFLSRWQRILKPWPDSHLWSAVCSYLNAILLLLILSLYSSHQMAGDSVGFTSDAFWTISTACKEDWEAHQGCWVHRHLPLPHAWEASHYLPKCWKLCQKPLDRHPTTDHRFSNTRMRHVCLWFVLFETKFQS